MSPRRELCLFAATLATLVAGFFHESLFGGKVLSPADVLRSTASFRDGRGPDFEPANRLLMDPVLQFQPWIEFNRTMIRQGRLPLWNDRAGCGAPHLANGQSAVFDPFQVLAYLGPLPDALAWMAAGRLWAAGLGMFLLARSWGLGGWGRWFAGLAFPFCGFLVVWLLYPVTNVAVWTPWLFWAGDRVLRRPGLRTVGLLGVITGLVLLGGHVQTSAHVLLAAGLWTLWQGLAALRGRRVEPIRETPEAEAQAEAPPGMAVQPIRVGRAWSGWGLGVALGVLLAAVEIVPLGFYLTRSPVWEDRERERAPAWRFSRPRVLGAVCTALPYAFGSQRRGQPHLGRALGVDNLNETAGGFAGLATLIWLAPLAWSRRKECPPARFLILLGGVGLCGSLALPPIDNLLRLLPVLGVTDNRRLSLWVAFALVLLGGIGLDRLDGARRTVRAWTGPMLWVGLAVVLFVAAAAVGRAEPLLRQRASAHYAAAAARTPGADPAEYQSRADRQVGATLRFVPRYLGLAGLQLLALAGLAVAARRGAPPRLVRAAVLGATLLDLFGFGYGLNPAIARSDHRPDVELVRYLRRELTPHGRVVAVGEELPPNTLMRYGLRDVRNYDSVELSRNLVYLDSLYEHDSPSQARTSRRDVTWSGVLRSLDRLREASVEAVVGATPPPEGAFSRVDRVGAVWVARIDGAAWIDARSPDVRLSFERTPGKISGVYESVEESRIVIRETFDEGWRAAVDGRPVFVGSYRDAFLEIEVPAGRRRLEVEYAPAELRIALGTSFFALVALVFALTLPRSFRSTRIIADGLGRIQAAELESDLCSSPATTRGIRR